jgi:DnaJ-class molecular chaperone
MEPATHYTALGLIPTAPLPVIKAAYKALVLIHHPDKTIHLSASERAHHSATFRLVQEAYDVLTNASMKASYDAELSRHGNRVDLQRSTFHRPSSSYSSRTPASTPASASATPTPNSTRKPTSKYFCNSRRADHRPQTM